MRKELLLAATAFFLMSVTVITGVKAFEEKAKMVTISSEESDITGDGIRETISLKGVPYENNDDYLKTIYIEISTKNTKRYSIPLGSGSKASLKMVDINRDGIVDIFANVLTEGSNGTTENYLFTLKDDVRKELTVPDPLEIDSRFENGYKAMITIGETGKTYMFDLKDRKKYYKKLGLYYKGKLNEPTELNVNSYESLKPIHIEEKGIGLKGIQRVTGVANGDTIAYVESSWNFENGKWNLFSAKVQTPEEK